MTYDERFEHSWYEIKNRIVERWSRISVGELDALKGNLDLLVTRIQAAYGCGPSRAETEYHEFRTSLRLLFQPAAVAPAARVPHRLAR